MESRIRIAIEVAIQGRIRCILVPWFISASSLITQKNSTQPRKDSLRIKSDSNKAMSWRKMETTHQGCLGSFLHFITPSTSKRNSCLSKRNQKKETNINHSIGEVKTKEQECNSLNAKMVGNKKK